MEMVVTKLNSATSYITIFKITYCHIKDTAGIRDGMNIHLVIFTGAGNVTPVGWWGEGLMVILSP